MPELTTTETKKRFGMPEFIPFDPDEVLLGYQKRWMADNSLSFI